MFLAAGSWALGWDALVAIGTLALAATTAIVAGFTYRVASKTSELADKTSVLAAATQADVAAQFRPVVSPGRISSGGADTWSFQNASGHQYCGITNVGRGPAMDLKVKARGSDQTVEIETSVLAVECKPERILIHPPIRQDAGGGFTIDVDYQNLGGEWYRSEIAYVLRAPNLWHARLVRVTSVEGSAPRANPDP